MLSWTVGLTKLGIFSVSQVRTDQKGAFLREMPQEGWEISPFAACAGGIRGIWNTCSVITRLNMKLVILPLMVSLNLTTGMFIVVPRVREATTHG